MSDATTTGKATWSPDDEPMTADDAWDNAVVCREAAEAAIEEGKPDVARVCYADVEGWLRRMLHLRGFPGATVRLKAKAELERRTGLG